MTNIGRITESAETVGITSPIRVVFSSQDPDKLFPVFLNGDSQEAVYINDQLGKLKERSHDFSSALASLASREERDPLQELLRGTQEAIAVIEGKEFGIIEILKEEQVPVGLGIHKFTDAESQQEKWWRLVADNQSLAHLGVEKPDDLSLLKNFFDMRWRIKFEAGSVVTLDMADALFDELDERGIDYSYTRAILSYVETISLN